MATPSPVSLNPFTKKQCSVKAAGLRKKAETLPVSKELPRLWSKIQKNQTTVVVSPTGSGKTTQVAKYIVEHDAAMLKPGFKRVAITQPRRLAVESVAARIAEEMDVPMGHVVGQRHRDRKETSDQTRLEVVTDGSLLATAKVDCTLRGYSYIIIDEAHQRSVQTDLLLGLLKRLLVKRADLKLIIMSATINAALFMDFFPGAVLEEVSGREHEVTVSYLNSHPEDALDTMVKAIMHVHLFGRPGDILVFTSGKSEMASIINGVKRVLGGQPEPLYEAQDLGPLKCFSLHAGLGSADQQLAIASAAPPPKHGLRGRKLIVSTNVAETSITLEGVTHVIDSCSVKTMLWEPEDETCSLRALSTSKAESGQRKGRAGRTQPGNAWRLLTQRDFDKGLSEDPMPTILQGDMLDECLTILKLNEDPRTFPFITPPSDHGLSKAWEILLRLGAIGKNGLLTPDGELMCVLPVNPYLARTILSSPEYSCSDEVLSLVAMVDASEGGSRVFIDVPRDQQKKISKIRAEFSHPSGDHLTLYNIYVAWRFAVDEGKAESFVKDKMLLRSTLKAADKTRDSLLKMLTMQKKEMWELKGKGPGRPDYYRAILKALAAGHFLKAAKRIPAEEVPPPQGSTKTRKPVTFYETTRHSVKAQLTVPDDLGPKGPKTASNEWVIYEHCRVKESKRFIELVSAIPVEDMIEAAPAYWADVEFMPAGHLQDNLVQAISKLTGQTEEFIRGGMGRPTAPRQE